MKVLFLKCDDWCAIYVSGKSVLQDHRIEPLELLELAEQYQFSFKDVIVEWASSENDEDASSCGSFPENQSELKGDYTA